MSSERNIRYDIKSLWLFLWCSYHQGFFCLKIKWLRQFKVSAMPIHPKTAFKFFFPFIVTTALMAISVLLFLPIEQALFQPSTRRFHKIIPQMHRRTDKYLGGVWVNVSPHHGLHDSRISHMTSPVGSRPLSCGPEQCWCWSPRIHRDRFHPPESEMKKIMPLLHWDTNTVIW